MRGNKGLGEGSADGLPPATASAIHDAIGIWINDFSITPEAVLRALAAKAAQCQVGWPGCGAPCLEAVSA